MTINLIAAMDKNRVIGKDNKLPWNIPEDLKTFRELTTGKSILMGRNTFFSIGKALPNRRNIVLTTSDLQNEGIEIYQSMDDFFQNGLFQNEDIFVIGGESIYKQFLDKAERIYLSLIKDEYEGDTFFPEFEDMFVEAQRYDKGDFDLIVYEKN